MVHTILIVDDAPMTRAFVRKFVTNAGYEALEAENGAMALEILWDRKVDLIICDLQMPTIGGIDFALLMRVHEMHADVPILMLSATTDQCMQGFGRNAGVSEWIGKPFSESCLIAAVRRLLPSCENAKDIHLAARE